MVKKFDPMCKKWQLVNAVTGIIQSYGIDSSKGGVNILYIQRHMINRSALAYSHSSNRDRECQDVAVR